MASCKKQSTKKYLKRSSPAYPANSCQGLTRKGNDGLIYTSVRASNGVYRWQKKKTSAKKQSIKRSTKRSGKKRSTTKKSKKRSSTKKIK
jgi:hypothetical protein